MVEDPDGLRSLRAPTREIAEFVSETYSFDRVHICAVDATLTPTTFRLSARDLQVCISIGRRSPLGWLLHLMPTAVAESTTWCALVDPLAALVVRGVRTRGTSRHGRREWYGATDQHRVAGVAGTLDGHDLGDLADLWPPVRFGFSSAPRRPSLVAVATTVET